MFNFVQNSDKIGVISTDVDFESRKHIKHEGGVGEKIIGKGF